MLTSNPSLSSKSLLARNKVADVELMRGDARLCAVICCDCNLWKPRMQCTGNICCPSEKKARPRNFFITTTFIIYNPIPDALHDLHTSECKRTHHRTYDGCRWKPAECNKVRTSKQLRFVANTETFNGNQALVQKAI